MTDPVLSLTALILSGGLGTRLRSVVSDRPKPMAMVDETPFIEILVRSLANKGVHDFVLLTGYMGDVIQEHFRRIVEHLVMRIREKSVIPVEGVTHDHR